jgi:CRP-like cAMP-binding protein
MPQTQNHSAAQSTSLDREPTPQIDGHPVHNLILASAYEQEQSLLRPFIRFVTSDKGENLYAPGEKIEFGYFPNAGLVSIVVNTVQGGTVEVGVVGKEGFIGLPILFGLDSSPHCAVIQVPPGEGFRIKAADLQNILRQSPDLETRLYRYSFLQGLIVAQIAACHRLHEVDQRLARWLLMSQDRLGSNFISLTQEFLAEMLGATRPTVTLAAGILQRSGAIQYTRGKVTILDRQLLEQAACECYGVIRNLSKDLGL